MSWGNLCLEFGLKKNGGNILVGQIYTALKLLGSEIPRLFALIPLAKDCGRTHLYLQQSADGAGSVKKLHLGQEQTVDLKNQVPKNK